MRKIGLLISALLITSCATQSFVVSEGANVKIDDKLDHFFVAGIAQEAINNAAEACGGEEFVHSVETVYTPLNWILVALTYNIYTPQQSKVYCLPR